MTDNLHDVLEETAGLAGSAGFDADALWRQGSREKHRSVALSVLSVVAVLALVSLSIWWGTGTTTPRPAAPVTTALTPAMPAHLYNPPADLASAGGLDVGPLAAVFMPNETTCSLGCRR